MRPIRLAALTLLLAFGASSQTLFDPPWGLSGTFNTLRNGIGTPANTLGNDGDFYLDLSTYILYGPKNSGVWPYSGVALGTFGGSGSTGSGSSGSGSPTIASSFADAEVPGGTVNGSNTAFTLVNAPSPATSLLLIRNGQVLEAGQDYTLSGANIAFVNSVVPVTGDNLQAWYRYSGVAATINYSDAEVPGGTVNGVNGSFTLLHPPAGRSLLLTRNGLVQEQGVDFTISGSTITFVTGAIPVTGELLQAWYRY